MDKYLALTIMICHGPCIVLLSMIATNVCELIGIDRYMWLGTIPTTLERMFPFRDASEEELIYECARGDGVGY